MKQRTSGASLLCQRFCLLLHAKNRKNTAHGINEHQGISVITYTLVQKPQEKPASGIEPNYNQNLDDQISTEGFKWINKKFFATMQKRSSD